MIENLISSKALLDLFTLTTLEVVLGIDNIIFIAIIIHNLPSQQKFNARIIGLSLALIMRILMLMGATWIINLTQPLFTLFSVDFSGRSLLLLIGGLFLIIKGILEIIEMFNHDDSEVIPEMNNNYKYWRAIAQIVFVDLILSFDSIITAVAMTDNMVIIITAIVFAIIVMLICSEPVGDFLNKHPSIKVIALCFIILVGIMLFCNGIDIDFPKTYLYSTLFFSIFVETINVMIRNKKSGR